MSLQDIVDIEELHKAIDILKPDKQLYEVRVFGASKRNVDSGYFKGFDSLAKALNVISFPGKNLYITLNSINEALYSRTQRNRFISNVSTTSDKDITGYKWFFIDLDPIRPADISSSDAELAEAEKLQQTVKAYLSKLGFPDPVEAISGNGYHLLYRVDLPPDNEHKELLSDCLSAVAMLFNNTAVKIDTVNFNQSRICKLYGTMAQKGANTKERPHRMSRILRHPDVLEVASEDLLKKLIAELPEESRQPQRQNTPYRTAKTDKQFDIREWLAVRGMTYNEKPGTDCQMLLLDECPFDPSHRNGDSKIFVYSNGAIAFKCHHDSCSSYRWQDVRRKYEPEAYERTLTDDQIEAGYQKHKKQQQEPPIPLIGDKTPPVPKKKKEPRRLKTAEALINRDIPEPKVFVGVDDELPILVEGTCILSAKPKLGKSWFALDMCLAIANGDDFIGYKTNRCSVLYLDLETSEAIQKKRFKKALKGRPVPKNFYLETETDTIDGGFVEQIESYMAEDPAIGVVVIDVFQIIRSSAKSQKESDYEHAYRDITPLNELAQKHHISIIMVCHDRKAVDPDDPFTNILGSTGLQGAASQMIVMFRKRKDDPIHISVKGKTIDGLPDLNVRLDNAEWLVVDGEDMAERERHEADEEYFASEIRKAVVAIANMHNVWQGRCSGLIQKAVDIDIPVVDSPKQVGGFLHRHIGRFLGKDGVKISIISNGTGGKLYRICKSTVDTVDENERLPLIEFEEPHKYKENEIPFF